MNQSVSGAAIQQIEIDFEAGLLALFPAFRDVVRAAVYGCGRPFKHIAGELEMTPSKLSRMLADNPNDPIHFPVDLLPELIEATGDKRPIYWLIERFLEDPDAKRRRALDHVAELMPRLELLLKTCSR
jgi:hypothetical protein